MAKSYHVPTHNSYNQDEPYRSVEQRRMKGCSCYTTYTKSVQGICKIIYLVFDFLVFVVIGASPYHLPVFILDYKTLPFHMVMLISIVCWLLVFAALIFFVTGYHLNKPHINWPKRELMLNILITTLTFIAVILELANTWRWDMKYATSGVGTPGDYILRYGAYAGGGMGSMIQGGVGYAGAGGIGYGGGLNSQFCGIETRFCDAYFRLLLGYNPYLANHVFGGVLLVLVFIVMVIATIFSIKTYRRFRRDMSRGGVEPEPKLSLLTRIRYHIWNVKTTSTNAIRESSSAIKDKISQMASKENLDEVDGSCVVDMSTGGDGDSTTLNGAIIMGAAASSRATSRSHLPSDVSTDVYPTKVNMDDDTIYKSEKSIRSKSSNKSERTEKTERSARSERSSKTVKSSRTDKSSRTERSSRSEGSRRSEDDRSYRSSRSSRHTRSSGDKRRSRKREDPITEQPEDEKEIPMANNHMASFVV